MATFGKLVKDGHKKMRLREWPATDFVVVTGPGKGKLHAKEHDLLNLPQPMPVNTVGGFFDKGDWEPLDLGGTK